MRHCPRCRAAFRTTRFCPRDGVPTLEDVEDPLLDHTLGGRYRILDVIASGGMGRVYRATHARIAALFAVKVLYGEMGQDDSLRSRFQREAEVASAMQSRHILRVFDFGETDEGLLYLAMEYLDGMSLATRIAREGTLDAPTALQIALQVARGLSHAHERGVVHRDLKSENVILVDEDDEQDVVKLLDFGVARTHAAAQKLTQIGQIVGTPQYMAPEQFSGKPVDARADLYALGVMLYEMLSGELPFRGDSLIAFAAQHATAAAPSLRARDPRISPGLEKIVQRLLAKLPDDRFPSARALGESLKAEARAAAGPAAAPWMADPRSERERDATLNLRPGPTVTTAALVERIRRAIQVGAPTYNSGDHAACYALYRDTATELARGALEGGDLAVAARLRIGLQRAAEMEPTPAAWEMRFAFDDLLQAAGDGGLTAEGELVARELQVARAVSERSYTAGRLDIVGDYYLELTRQMAARVGGSGRRALDAAVAAAEAEGGGAAALAGLSVALERITIGPSRTGLRPVAEPLALDGCPRLPELARRATEAIAAGAPAYNAGDVAACDRVFRRAAREMIAQLTDEPACAAASARLERALEEAAGLPDDRAVWVLRRALDDLIAAAR